MRIVTLLTLCAVLCCSQGHKQEECLNEYIPLPMIKDMLNTSELIEKSLPKDNAPSRRILGKLPKKSCPKILNVTYISRILDIYDEHVFKRFWSNNTDDLPKRFTDSFARLRNHLETCANTSKQTLSHCGKSNLIKIKKNLMMLQRKDLSKAHSEFRNVLLWISKILDRSKTHGTH